MDGLYEALIGEGAGDAEKAKLIAAALRRRNEMGQLGMITGDKALSPVGKGLSQSSDEYAEMLQQIRQNQARQNQTETYQTGQLDYMDRNLAETKRNNDMDHEYQMAMARAAGIKADKAPTGPKMPKLRQGDIKELQDLSEGVGIVQDLEKYLAEGGKFGAVEAAGLPLPGARMFKNYAASKGYGSDEDKTAFKKKQEWDRMYTLVTRNRLFGATLTPNEQTAWEQANPSVAQTDEQIAGALPVMRKIMNHRMTKKASGLIKEGYSAEALADYTDIPGINVPGSLDDSQEDAAAPPAGAGSGAPKKRVRVDAQGNIIP